MASKFGYCPVMGRDHELGDFHSREMINTVHTSTDGREYLKGDMPGKHEEVCRHCGRVPGK